jgi:hypothetical protein
MSTKQKEGLKKFHENKNKPTSADIPRKPRALGAVGKKLSTLTPASIDLIGKAVLGELVQEKSIWKGTEEDKAKKLESDPSVSFETLQLDNGKEVEVIVEYVQVPKHKIEIAKWIITQDIAVKKAAEESRLRKLEVALREKKAKDEGVIPEVDPQEAAKEFGGPRKLDPNDFDFPEDDEDI